MVSYSKGHKGVWMSAVNLEKSLQSLKRCYVGKSDEGQYVLDKSKIDELTWMFATHRIYQALNNKEITQESITNLLEGNDE